jgi:hypothetical protein
METMESKDQVRLSYKQEVRGSSPRAPHQESITYEQNLVSGQFRTPDFAVLFCRFCPPIAHLPGTIRSESAHEAPTAALSAFSFRIRARSVQTLDDFHCAAVRA